MRYDVDYPGHTITLDMWVVTSWTGTVRGLDGQEWKWVEPVALEHEDILEADQPIVAKLMELGQSPVTR